MTRYCQHFQYLKISEALYFDREAVCKYCFAGPLNLWLCLSKNCNTYVCTKNTSEHLISHLEQSRRNKKFHSIFINPATTQIRCVQCNIQIGDLDAVNQQLKGKQDPFPYRVKLLPGLGELMQHKIVGQLQNSQGHRKISKGLAGIFSNKYNYSINAAIQFIQHCNFFRQLLLQTKIAENKKILRSLQDVIGQIDSGKYRAIHSDTISELLYQQFPQLLGYKRKDPFDTILYLLNLINDQTLFYSLTDNKEEEQIDQWDIFYKRNSLTVHHQVYSAIEATLSLNYFCTRCQQSTSVPHNIQFLKLSIPKKKRKTKEIQKQLATHRCTSPVKNRRKSLINLFKQQQCPLTIAELIIDLMKAPLHRELYCQTCSQPLKKTKLHFQKLPDVLIIQISRFTKQSGAVDQSPVQLSTDSLDLGTFTSAPEQQMLYDFETALCIQKGCLFPIVVMGLYNKQKYIIKGETVQLCKQKVNPYLLCYRRRISETAKQKLVQIADDLSDEKRNKTYKLPDYWYLQLQHGIQRPFINQFVCKHNELKPNVQSRMQALTYVSEDVYQDLINFYKPVKVGSASKLRKSSQSSSPGLKPIKRRVYIQKQCQTCLQQLYQITERRKKQRQFVLSYDKLRNDSLPYCMISSGWIKKWSNYLYRKEGFSYMSKGYPMPPSIDNKCLLDGNRCKPNLIKNQQYKILNIYLWKMLKQTYGGGPQIRYKWKEGRQNLDQELLNQIRSQAAQLKYMFASNYLESPKKLSTSVSFIQKSTIEQGGSSTMIEDIDEHQKD